MPEQGPIRRILANVILIGAGTLCGAVLAEGLSRLVLDPVDYLAAPAVADPVLGLRIAPFVSGHDEWGFRNREVPERAEIVTIGDSQTYGIGAPASRSWPAQLAALTGLRVYNLALGGYSPVQYGELLQSRALALQPLVVVVGFYYGNDLWDAHRVVYGLDHWRFLRRPELPPVDFGPGAVSERRVVLEGLRNWLAAHSVAYRLLVFSALGSRVQQAERRSRAPFVHPVHSATTAFTPKIRLEGLDLENANIREGLRLSLDRLEWMAEQCRRAGVRLLVALIPTKERVHEPWITGRSDLAGYDNLKVLLRAERQADRQVRSFLGARGIPYLDLSIPLREAAGARAIYPPHEDGHPNAAGYAAIAEAVAATIRPWVAEGATLTTH